jgi:hypothetical protein
VLLPTIKRREQKLRVRFRRSLGAVPARRVVGFTQTKRALPGRKANVALGSPAVASPGGKAAIEQTGLHLRLAGGRLSLPAGKKPPRHMTTVQDGLNVRSYWDLASCQACALKLQCTPSRERRIRPWGARGGDRGQAGAAGASARRDSCAQGDGRACVRHAGPTSGHSKRPPDLGG